MSNKSKEIHFWDFECAFVDIGGESGLSEFTKGVEDFFLTFFLCFSSPMEGLMDREVISG